MNKLTTIPEYTPTPSSLPEHTMLAGNPCTIFHEKPVRLSTLGMGAYLIDFGLVAFGNLEITPPARTKGEIVVHFGESFTAGRIDRQPPGSVRYARASVSLDGSGTPIIVATPADERNTNELAVPLPPEWGVVLPFRWIEIEGWPSFEPPVLRRRSIYAKSWDDTAASFASSSSLLDRIWELCRRTIKATTFAGVYVDGDRERRPYEADAYLNQLSHYACDSDFSMARNTFDYLIQRPTRSTEWASHMVFIAHADWLHTGDTAWVGARYEALKEKLLLERARSDGLIVGISKQVDNGIVDWPAGECDGYVFTPVNTVVNAFHLRSLTLMAEIARALDKTADADTYEARARITGAAFRRLLFDPTRGLYCDGEGTDHVSLHANLFPLAFGLVPVEHRAGLLAFLIGKGMACSVYAAQYLLETLFDHDADEAAFALITANGDRSWKHMIESGATLTWEAWDQRYKPNLDWNHAWGAAPANLLPRYALGAQVLSPGWSRLLIRPHPGPLTTCTGKIPTPRGPVEIEWRKETDVFTLAFSLPPETSTRLELPAFGKGSVRINGQSVEAVRHEHRLHISGEWNGSCRVEVR